MAILAAARIIVVMREVLIAENDNIGIRTTTDDARVAVAIIEEL